MQGQQNSRANKSRAKNVCRKLVNLVWDLLELFIH